MLTGVHRSVCPRHRNCRRRSPMTWASTGRPCAAGVRLGDERRGAGPRPARAVTVGIEAAGSAPGWVGDRRSHAHRPGHRRPARRAADPRQPRRGHHAHRPRSPMLATPLQHRPTVLLTVGMPRPRDGLRVARMSVATWRVWPDRTPCIASSEGSRRHSLFDLAEAAQATRPTSIPSSCRRWGFGSGCHCIMGENGWSGETGQWRMYQSKPRPIKIPVRGSDRSTGSSRGHQ